MVQQTETSKTTATLISWACGLKAEDIPLAVRQHVARLILDGIGAGLYGSTTPWARHVGDLVAEAGGTEESTIWGYGFAVPAPQAALANGTFMHSFELDDLHPAAVIHGGAQIIPPALAIAGRRSKEDPATADEFIVACVAGFEIGARIGLATGAEQLGRGFHPSPNTGLFSAAVTAGLLSGLDERGLSDAFGIAASSGGFLMAAQYGAMVKRMHPGRSAQAGVMAALLAARGFTGIENVIEEPYGGFAHAYAGIGSEKLDGVVQRLNDHWETSHFGFKPYPSCGSNHTSIDAYLAILRENPDLTPQDISHVDIWCSTRTAEHVGWPYVPRSVTSAQMNLAYTVAATAADGQLTVDQYTSERIADPTLVDFASRVNVHADPSIDAKGRLARHNVRLRVTRTDGRAYEQFVSHAPGSPSRPLSPERIVEKFRGLAGHVIDADQTQMIEASALALADGGSDSTGVTRLLTALDHKHFSRSTTA